MKFIRKVFSHHSYPLLFSVRLSSNVHVECVKEGDNKNNEVLLNTEPKSIYYFEDGLRKVYPFYFQYKAFCKGRWINKRIIDMYLGEFADRTDEEITWRIFTGLIKVNNKVVSPDYVLKNKDMITSIVHRHELAVLPCPIQIIFENNDLLVVDKPPSLPVYPCGLYYYNTVQSVLSNEYNKHNLYVTYRLDRLTSGVLLFAKSSKKSREVHDEMNTRNIKKEYVCRVDGNFPEGSVMCDKPIKHIYHRIGTCLIHPKGKPAMTEFQKLSYNGKSSVVLCKPYTGRTHQIRVHLQYLGHPIINDPLYNSFVFGKFKGRNGIVEKSINELIDDILKEHSAQWGVHKVPTIENNSVESEKDFLKFSIFKEFYCVDEKLLSYKKDHTKIIQDKNCSYCKSAKQDPEQPSLGMFLHAYKYEGKNWTFKSDFPFWASDDWDLA